MQIDGTEGENEIKRINETAARQTKKKILKKKDNSNRLYNSNDLWLDFGALTRSCCPDGEQVTSRRKPKEDGG